MPRKRPSQAQSMQRSGSDAVHFHAEATSVWEWIAAAVGAVMVAAAVAYMIYAGLSHSQGPPKTMVEALSAAPSGAGYLVQFRVRNEGNSTAAALLVHGELLEQGSSIEESEATLDYLPQHSEREGGLFFMHDPSRYELRLRVKGYAKP
jgi:uncharacterized protein (TIGR02588 family)